MIPGERTFEFSGFSCYEGQWAVMRCARENGLKPYEPESRGNRFAAPRKVQPAEERVFPQLSGPHLTLHPGDDRPGTVLFSAFRDWGGLRRAECGRWSFPSYFAALAAVLAAWREEAMGWLFLHSQSDATADCKILTHPVANDDTRRLQLHMDEASALVIWPLLPREWEIVRIEAPEWWAGRWVYRLVCSTSDDERSVELRPTWALWDTYNTKSRFIAPSGSTVGDVTAITGPGVDLELAMSDTALKWHAEGRIVGKTHLDVGRVPLSAFDLQPFGTSRRHRYLGAKEAGFSHRNVGRSPAFGSSRQRPQTALSGPLKEACTWSDLNGWLRTLDPETEVGIILTCDRVLEPEEHAEVLRLLAAYPGRILILVACRQEEITGIQAMRW